MKSPQLLRHIAAVALTLTVLPGVSLRTSAQTLENLWEITAPDLEGILLATDNSTRGLTYNSRSNQVIVASRTGGNKAAIFNGDTGVVEGYMSMGDINGGSTFTWNSVACADDGVLYGFNVSATTFKIYRWDSTDPSLLSTVAFGPGDPANGLVLPGARWGDNVAIRGGGINTEILVSSWGNTNVALFTTADGTNFSPIRIDIAGINNNDVRDGLAFYTNNTFWAKRIGRPLILVRYTLTSPTTASGVVIESFTGGPNLSPLGCNPAARLLAGVTFTTPGQLHLFDLSALPPTSIAQTNFLVSNANGNGTGAVAFGGEGRTNRIYALWSNNGIKAAQIVWTGPPSAPTISAQPAGLTVYTNFPSATLTVTASGTAPLAYQWYYNAAPVAGATANSFTKNGPLVTSHSGSYTVVITNVAGAITSAPAALNVIEPQLTAVMTPLWTLTNSSRAYLQNDNNARGMACDPVNGNLVIVSRTGGSNAIYALSASTGADLFTLDTTGIVSGGGYGTFGLNMIGVAADGAVYAGNLTINTADGYFKLYRWGSLDALAFPSYAFDGEPLPGQSLRWGDSLAVRGAGAGTQVLIGSTTGSGTGGAPGQYVALFTTLDGTYFTPQVLTAPAGTPNGFAQLGIAFGSGNTIWAKSTGYRLRHYSFDPTFTDPSLTLLGEYDLPARLVPTTGIAVDASRALLAAVEVANPDNLQLYRLSTTTNPPVLLDQEFFATDNANGNATAAVAFGTNNTLFALDTNNGLVARNLNLAAALPPLRITGITPTATPAPGALITWQSLVGGTYQLQSKGSLSETGWTDAGAPVVANGPLTTVSDTGTGFTNRFYRVERKP